MIGWLLAMVLQGPDPLATAERELAAGNLEAAVSAFTSALADPGIPPGPVLANLGRCAMQLNRPAEAIWYLRRAQLRLPDDATIAADLQLAEAACGFDGQDRPQPGVLDRIGSSELLWTGAALQAAGLLLLILGAGRTRKFGVALTAAGVLTHGLVATRLWFPSAPLAVVLAPRTELLQEPRLGAGIVIPLHAGDLVTVVGTNDTFAEVTHPRGRGHLPLLQLGIIN